MIKFYSQTLDGEVEITFKHTTKDFALDRPGTDCAVVIIEKNGKQKFGSASSFCHPKDSFNRVVGRKVALAGALKQLALTKDQKKEIWHKLFEQVKR